MFVIWWSLRKWTCHTVPLWTLILGKKWQQEFICHIHQPDRRKITSNIAKKCIEFMICQFVFLSHFQFVLHVYMKAVPKRPSKRLQTSGKTKVPDGTTPEVSRNCAEGANNICKIEGQCCYLWRTLQVCEEVPSQRCQVVPRTQCNQVRILLLVDVIRGEFHHLEQIHFQSSG